MAINPPAHNAAQAGRPRLRKSLKLWQVVMMGLAPQSIRVADFFLLQNNHLKMVAILPAAAPMYLCHLCIGFHLKIKTLP